MASRLDAVPRKKGGTQPSFYRAKKICALVPKSGKKSEDDESGSDDEVKQISTGLRHVTVNKHVDNDDSSPAPSLPSSIENLNLLSDEEIVDVQDAVTQSPLLPSPQPLSFLARQTSLTQNVCPSPISVSSQPSSPSIASNSRPTIRSTTSGRTPRIAIPRQRPICQKPLNFHWTKNKFKHCAEISDINLSQPEIIKTPYEYFTDFFTEDIFDFITEHTNLYYMQQTGKTVNVTKDDIKTFVAINLLMGIVDLPAYTDYWSREFRYSSIADNMPLKKFQLIRRYIHFNNNLLDDGDRYFKVRPLLQKIRDKFVKVPHETRFSVDEMMVPYKGKKAGNRKQYVKNKPKKWGYKIFVRAGVSGFVYDFIVYGGEDTFRYDPLTLEESSFGLGAKVVLALCKSIPDRTCSVVYFDNFFTSLELIHYLREEMGIFSLGTIRSNRLRDAANSLATDKVLKKKPRGSHSQVVCNKNKLSVIKWYDNKCVTTASSYIGAEPLTTIQRYDKVKKQRIAVPCPEIIKHYNAHMGGVDLADMLIALYRTDFRGHRWYLPIVSQILDMCINNSWILYRRHTVQKTMPLKMFRYQVVQGLLKHGRKDTVDNSEVSGPTPSKIIQKPVAPRPSSDVRYDEVGHFPVFGSKGRCKYCVKGQTTVACSKCSLRLCLTPERNCFVKFHTDK